MKRWVMDLKYRVFSKNDCHSIQFKSKKWFGLFGEYVWKPYKEIVSIHVRSGLPILEVIKYNCFHEAVKKCDLLNGK